MPSHSLRRCVPALTALLAAAALAGCITVGAEFPAQALDQLKPGTTTEAEVLTLLGNPVRTGITDEGTREWTYAYYHGGPFSPVQGRDVEIKFDKEGRVKSLSYHATDPTDPRVQVH